MGAVKEVFPVSNLGELNFIERSTLGFNLLDTIDISEGHSNSLNNLRFFTITSVFLMFSKTESYLQENLMVN